MKTTEVNIGNWEPELELVFPPCDLRSNELDAISLFVTERQSTTNAEAEGGFALLDAAADEPLTGEGSDG